MQTPLQTALAYLDSIEQIEQQAFDNLIEIAVPILRQQFEQELEQEFDWDNLAKDAEPQENDEGGIVYLTFVGTVFALSPSGKYYTPWARSNVEDWEAVLDAAYYDALDIVANKHGGWIESGDGDPCDLFFFTHKDN